MGVLNSCFQNPSESSGFLTAGFNHILKTLIDNRVSLITAGSLDMDVLMEFSILLHGIVILKRLSVSVRVCFLRFWRNKLAMGHVR